MLLYKDVFSGDEMLTDAYKLIEPTDNDAVYEIDCTMIQIKQGADVDIGANPSAEEADESVEDGVETVNNIVYSMRLAPTTFDKKSYLTYVKGYMKKLKAKLQEIHPERVEAFEKGAQAYVKKVIGSFKDWEFFTGETMDTDGMVALLNYRDDGVTPYIVFFKDGLEEVKL